MCVKKMAYNADGSVYGGIEREYNDFGSLVRETQYEDGGVMGKYEYEYDGEP